MFSEVYFPWGWHATIDGTPVEIGRVNYLLRAIKLPAGEHTIEMSFNPKSLNVTVSIAYVSIVCIYIIMIIAVGLSTKKLWSNKPNQSD